MKIPRQEKERDIDAVVISPAWPSGSSGYGMAVRSSLAQYVQFFTHTYFLGLVDRPFFHPEQWDPEKVSFLHIAVTKPSKPARFLEGTFRRLPATVTPFARRSVTRKVLTAIRNLKHTRPFVVIFEDMPPAVLLLCIRSSFPAIPIAVRSHNVLSKAFEGFAYGQPRTTCGNLESRLAVSWFGRLGWRLEVKKLRKFEERTYESADKFWAISENDRREYRDRLGIHCDGIFGVALDDSHYAGVAGGDIKTLVYVGSADLRKGAGLVKFIKHAWVDIRRAVPGAKLLLAGRGTDQLTNPSLGVIGAGFINDDRDILRRGLIFVNPQEYGSGIKLKSIVAMLSGRALVGTETALEGIEGTAGQHFFIAKHIKDMAPIIIDLMYHEDRALEVGERARQLAVRTYSEERLEATVKPLLQDLVEGCRGNV